jgi:hypothetical protein
LLRHRASLVRLATGLKNRVHAVLADRGIPARSGLWAAPGRRGLRRWSCRRPHARSSRTAGGCWTPWPPRSPAWRGDRRAGQARPRGPGPHGLGRRGQADRHDLGRRDR